MAKISQVSARIDELSKKRNLSGSESQELRNLQNIRFKYRRDPEFKRAFNQDDKYYFTTQPLGQEYDVQQAQNILNASPEGQTAKERLEATKTFVRSGGEITYEQQKVQAQQQNTPFARKSFENAQFINIDDINNPQAPIYQQRISLNNYKTPDRIYMSDRALSQATIQQKRVQALDYRYNDQGFNAVEISRTQNKKNQQVTNKIDYGFDVNTLGFNDFNRKALAQQERQRNFENSQGLKNIREMTNFLTFGGGTPYEKRSYGGKVAENVLYTFTGGPIELGGSLASSGEKLYLTQEALRYPELRSGVFQEYKRSGKETLKIYDPFTPEGTSLYLTAGLIAFPTASAKVSKSRNSVLFDDFKEVKQTKTDVLFSQKTERVNYGRYIESNVLPQADFLASEIVKSKRTSISKNPEVISLKFELFDKGRSGIRNIYQDLNSGKVSITERIKSGKKDYIKTIDYLGNNQFQVKAYNTKDFLKNKNPFLNKKIYSQERQISLSSSKENLPYFELQKGSGSKQRSGTIFKKETLFGDYVQSTTIKYEVLQKIKLDKKYLVSSDSELGLIYNTKGSYIGPIEKYYSQKARGVFGKEELYPNIIKREGVKVSEFKYPQTISESFYMKDIDINIRQLNRNEAKALRQEKTQGQFREVSLFGGRIKYYKGIDIPLRERVFPNKPLIVAEKLLSSKRGSLILEKQKVREIGISRSSVGLDFNINQFNLRYPSVKQNLNVFNIPRSFKKTNSYYDSVTNTRSENKQQLKPFFKQESSFDIKFKLDNKRDLRQDLFFKQKTSQEQKRESVQELSFTSELTRSTFKNPISRFINPRPKNIPYRPFFTPLIFRKDKKTKTFKKLYNTKGFKFNFKEKPRKFDILPSLREVNIYEARTGKEAIKPKKTAKIKRLFEEQYFGKGNFETLIPEEFGRRKRKL